MQAVTGVKHTTIDKLGQLAKHETNIHINTDRYAGLCLYMQMLWHLGTSIIYNIHTLTRQYTVQTDTHTIVHVKHSGIFGC